MKMRHFKDIKKHTVLLAYEPVISFTPKEIAETSRFCKALCSDETYKLAIEGKSDEEIFEIALLSYLNSPRFRENMTINFPRRKENLVYPK